MADTLAEQFDLSDRTTLAVLGLIALFVCVGTYWAYLRTLAEVFPPAAGAGLALFVGGGVFLALALELRQQRDRLG